MKYLSNYTDDAVSEALKTNGAFFAFSDKQFDEAKKDGIKYISLGGGLISPENTATQLMDDMEKTIKNGIEQDIKENGIDNIIIRELANHEAYYNYDIESTIDALKSYNIPTEKIKEIFSQEKVKHYND